MAENILELKKDMNPQIEKTLWVPSRIKKNKPILRYITVKWKNTTWKNFLERKDGLDFYKRITTGLITHFTKKEKKKVDENDKSSKDRRKTVNVVS